MAVVLVVAGFLLVALFRDHIQRRFDAQLRDHLVELLAAAEIDTTGTFGLTWTPSDPRFNLLRSGWYWSVRQDGEVVARSRSLWFDHIDMAAPVATGSVTFGRATAPDGAVLRAAAESVTLPGSSARFVFIVAGPVSNIETAVTGFASIVAIALSVLAAGLLGALLLQVRFGLRPLRRMRRALADIRAGRAARLPEDFPREVQPVAHELNALLDHSATLLERARTQAGNLAHALKNPLTVIRNEARSVRGARGAVLREQAETMNRSVERHLARARAAGMNGVLGARTDIGEVVADLCFGMETLHRERALAIEREGLDGLQFRGDADDLEEMLGNLLDNACKWATRRVRISGRHDGDRLHLVVEDDGPGIPAAKAAEVLRRGRRLDEEAPGNGLGLDIVQDLAGLCRGALTLDRSPLGGLRATLDLPAAD